MLHNNNGYLKLIINLIIFMKNLEIRKRSKNLWVIVYDHYLICRSLEQKLRISTES
jgi:hypothetical protein